VETQIPNPFKKVGEDNDDDDQFFDDDFGFTEKGKTVEFFLDT
jgi:hypothetical protein